MREDGAGAAAILATNAETLDERRSLDRLYSATYEELRRLAATIRRGSALATLSPTTLVNEAWITQNGVLWFHGSVRATRKPIMTSR